eukprot:1284746-Rhodomonas_salina.2
MLIRRRRVRTRGQVVSSESSVDVDGGLLSLRHATAKSNKRKRSRKQHCSPRYAELVWLYVFDMESEAGASDKQGPSRAEQEG